MKPYPFIFVLFFGCGSDGDPPDTDSDTDTDSGQTTNDDHWFDEAELVPPFEHVNTVWSGVALLDYDDDGWLDIFFPNGLTAKDALYRNQGDGTFVDMAEEAGVDSLGENGAAVAGDLDNDGDTDLVVNTACSTGTYDELGGVFLDGGAILYLNNGDGTFTDVDIDLGDEDPEIMTWCTTSLGLADYDGDGVLDMLVSNHVDPDLNPPWIFTKTDDYARNFILLGDGDGNFSKGVIFEETDTTEYYVSFVMASLDVDMDGRLDLLIGQGGDALRVCPQAEDGSFGTDKLVEAQDSGRGLWMGLAVADYDGDLDFDVYATNQGLSPYMVGYDNTYAIDLVMDEWINNSHSLLLYEDDEFAPADWPVEAEFLLAGDLFDGLNGTYDDWMEPQGLDRYPWSWGAVPLDADADGWMDVAFTSNNCSPPMCIIWTEDLGAGPGGLLLNDKGQGFIDVTWEAGVENTDELGQYQDGRGIATGDLNNDGYADLVYANRSYNSSQTDPLAQEVGVPHVFLSRERDANWLQIDLEGTTSNRDGIGSVVRITTEETERVYIFGAGGSTNSSNERLVTLGLGDATSVDIEVIFPSGNSVEVTDVQANQRITIEES